jgi:hypothetical protein
MRLTSPEDDSGTSYRNVGSGREVAAALLSVTTLASRDSGGCTRVNGAAPSPKFFGICRVDHPCFREKVSTNYNSTGWKRIKLIIYERYGAVSYNMFLHLKDCTIGVVKNRSKLIFLKRCRDNGLFPKTMEVNFHQTSHRIKKVLDQAKSSILIATIRDLREEINKLEGIIKSLEKRLVFRFRKDIFFQMKFLIDNSRDRVFLNEKDKHIDRFNQLRNLKFPKNNHKVSGFGQTKEANRFVVNLSKKVLSEQEVKVLSLGMNYALQPRNKKDVIIDTIVSIDSSLKRFNVDELKSNDIKTKVASIIQGMKFNNYNKQDLGILKIVKSLKEDENIVISKADKGNTTVVMDKIEYESKVNAMLSVGPYDKVRKDPTAKVEKEIKGLLKVLLEGKLIEKGTHNWLNPCNTRSPKLYGLPKIHKVDIPLRPIVCTIGSPTYPLAKYVSRILGPLLDGSEFVVRNSVNFVEILNELEILEDESMISFDVVSLFTSCPIDDTLGFTKELLASNTDWKSKTKLGDFEVLEIMEKCLRCTYFQWKGNFYQQTEGAAMGSPLSPIFANIFMDKLERSIVPNCSGIRVWKRYVDDIWAIIKSRDLDSILYRLNSFHPSIQFTFEQEKNRNLAFLDVLVSRIQNGKLGHTVYRKPTHTDRYLNFNSYHTLGHKLSVIDSLVYRAFAVCDKLSLSKELFHISQALLNNNFPLKIIKNSISKMRNRFMSKSNLKPNGNEEDMKRIAIPLYKEVSNKIGRLLRKEGFYTAYRPGLKLGNVLGNPKDKVDARDRSCIYEITCSCSSKYIGETGRSLNSRLKEHQAATRNGKTQASAVAKHCWEDNSANHSIDWDNSKIVELEDRFWHRKYKEHMHISRSCSKLMNLDTGWQVSDIWKPILFSKNY